MELTGDIPRLFIGLIMSKTSIVNKALSHLGANKITSLSDGSLESQCANILYEGSLRSVLSECCWKFATKRVMLNKIDKCPAWAENGMFNYFQLQSDLVKLEQYYGIEKVKPYLQIQILLELNMFIYAMILHNIHNIL